MNHTYRLVWNQEAQRYVPAPECAKGRGKSKAGKTLAPAAVLLAAAFALPTWAAPPAANTLPTGGQVVSGSASIGQSGSQMTVNQGSQKAIIDWTSFDIGKNAGVTFVQPNANAVALNRVTAGDASQIHGQLNANGQVWLINPNGVVFGQGSKVDVGGLVASTLNITNADFNNGNYRFTRNGATGSISNQGEITAKDGGSIALLAPTVSNDGIIRAQLGTVAMAAGDQITLQAGANGLLNVHVDPATVRTLIENKQLIVADGGQVIMTGKAADALSASVVANTGTIQANTLQERDGKILLIADMRHGETKAAGKLEAKFIDTSAATVTIDKDLKVNTHGGEWLIDPVNITIDANKATAIQTALGTGNVTVSTADVANNTGWGGGTNGTGSEPGDIHVNADISYSKNTLTLTADRDINVNAQINVNGSGTLALYHGSSANVNVKGLVNFDKTGTGLLAINGANYTVIKDVTALQGMSGTSHFALGDHIDASATAGWNGGAGFNPLNLSNGVFDGLGHTISGLTINRPAQERVGLFGTATNSTLRNVGLQGGSVAGLKYVGALVGWNDAKGGRARIANAYASTKVTGEGAVGGLVGYNIAAAKGETASITNAYATGQVSGDSNIGGLVGMNLAFSEGTASIANAYATGEVRADSYAGGLVGRNSANGSNSMVTISNVYASGQVVAGTNRVGGLVGAHEAWNGGTASVSNASWDSASTGQSNGLESSADGTSTNTNSASVDHTNRYQHASYAQLGTWSETTTGSGVWQAADATGVQWIMLEGQTRPFLASEYSTTIRNAHQLQLMAYDLGASYRLTSHIDASATAGSNASGMWSSQGFSPVGAHGQFTGAFDGQSHTIGGLTINRPNENDVGLFGHLLNATLRNVGLVNASVVGRDNVGALVGWFQANNSGRSYIDNVFSTGAVTGAITVGGLVGYFDAFSSGSAFITNAYAAGTVSATGSNAGGLVGRHYSGLGGTAYLNNVYVTGAVSGASGAGGLVGASHGLLSVNNSFWDIGTTGQAVSAGGQGKTTNELQQASTFASWGSAISAKGGEDTVWRIYEGQTGPLLRSFLQQVIVTADSSSASKTYDGNTAFDVSNYTTDVAGALLDGSLRYIANSKNAGDYRKADGTLTMDGLYSSQQGYDISYANTDAMLTISKKALTVSGTTATAREYNGTRNAEVTVGSITGYVGSESLDITGSGIFDSHNAGSRSATARYTLADGAGGGLAENYSLADTSGHMANIGKAAITISANDVSKTYDGITAANGTATVTGGTLFGSDSLSGGSFAYTDKNAGLNKTVSVSGVTVNDGNGGGNYDVSYVANTGSTIDKSALTITASNANKILGSTLVLNGSTGFTASGLAQGEVVDSVTLESAGTPSSAMVGSYAIQASNAAGGIGFDAGNYDIRYVDGSLSVISLMTGGVIWREARTQALPAGGQPREADITQIASSGVPNLTLAPGFIRVQEGE